ncbi:MAG TPA: FadR/GntR family transcriptional regulator [Ktedonobacteraceae bacterium]|nr:FadR/GntR family transcriptional regulator [Ktedonobacteraceae bacterium]
MSRSDPETETAIKPLHLSNARSSAAEQLRNLIETGHFAPGDRLPSERKLAELLGVSRTLVREAISTLEAVGLIEVRHGSGSYVTGKIPEHNLSTMWSMWYTAHHQDLIHLLQVREALETKAAGLAAEQAKPDLVKRLRRLLEAMRIAGACGKLDEVSLLDSQFHGAIVAASGNPILEQLLSSLNAVLTNDRVAVFSLPDRLGRSLRDHASIIEAIERRDALAAQAALHQHFDSVLRDVEQETKKHEAQHADQ